MHDIIIYTDGACKGNPGPGGWAAIVHLENRELVLKGYELDTTNNRMELMAAIKALRMARRKAKKSARLLIYSDSAYVVNAVKQNWIDKWKQNGWRTTSNNQDIKNRDLWESLDNILRTIRAGVKLIKIKGKSDRISKQVDKIAKEEAQKAFDIINKNNK